MIKKYALIFIAFFGAMSMGFGQILTFEFSGLAGNEVSANSNYNDTNLTLSTIDRGAGLTASNNAGRFNATSWALTSISNAVSGNDYMEFTITPTATYQFDVTTITLNFQRSSTGPRGLALRNSLDGFATNIDGEKPIIDNGSTQVIVFTVNQANSSSAVIYRVYGWAESTGGSGGIGDGSGNDLIVNGTVTSTSTDDVDWANVQSPPNGTIDLGNVFNVYARTWENGVTNIGSPGAGITAWIGYNTTDTNPSTWPAGNWELATFNGDFVNDDEFVADIGSVIPAIGNYFYASRFQLNGGPMRYGAYSAGGGDFWDGVTYVNGSLTVNARTPDWYNLQSPGGTSNITTGAVFDVYGQIYEPGITDTPASQGPNIQAWIGYSSTDSNPSGGGWTWVNASYNPACGANCGTPENNDEYFVDIGSSLPAGTYYYASRFTIDNPSVYYYGGYNVGGGGSWDGTVNVNGELIITDPPISTCLSDGFSNAEGWENHSGFWTEIANAGTYYGNGMYAASGSEGYGGAGRFLGFNDVGDNIELPTVDNPVELTYWARLSSPATGSNKMKVQYFNGSMWVDIVEHQHDTETYTQFTADLNFLNAQTGVRLRLYRSADNRSHYIDNLEITCGTGTLVPELQLVDNTTSNQDCGSFTINFGGQDVSTNTDITFDIKNLGTDVLTVNSITLSGDEPGDYSVSPTSFSVGVGSSTTVTVTFTPSAGSTNPIEAALTIDNDDSNEGTCVIDLTGDRNDPEIDIERNTLSSIPSSTCVSNPPNTGNNTLFGITPQESTSAAKQYFIHNEGTSDLIVNSISLASDVDFNLINLPASFPVTIISGNSVSFEIEFAPSTTGSLEDTVTILSNDSDESTYTFCVGGTGDCTVVSYTSLPTTGPPNTIVNIQGPELEFVNSVLYNGVSQTPINISPTELEITIPLNAVTGNISFVDDLGCTRTIPFTVITSQISGCEGNSFTPTDIFISEVTDESSNVGGHSYIELFNGTGSAINIDNYELRMHYNGNPTAFYTIDLPNFNLPNDNVYVVEIGDGGDQVGNDPAGPGTTDFSYNGNGINDQDNIRLYKNSSTYVDLWGDTSGNPFTGGIGLSGGSTPTPNGSDYTFRRKNTGITAPSTTWDANDWDSTTPVDYSNVGNFDFSTGAAPSISTQPSAPSSGCDISVSLTVDAIEGYNGSSPADTQELRYYWYYLAPGSNTWNLVPNFSPYTFAVGNNNPDLTIDLSSSQDLNDYQYYCQIREEGVNCYTASDATQLDVQRAVWQSGAWVNGIMPDATKIVIIDDSYITTPTTSIDACNLIVNSTRLLNVDNSSYVRVVNDVINNGTINVQTQGSFVQDGVGIAGSGTSGTFTNNGAASVIKVTDNLNDWYEYTYWSSPVIGQTVETAFPNTPPNRRFYFDTSNYWDEHTDGTTNGIPDDIDDAAPFDWQVASGVMQPAQGYAATSSPLAMFPGTDQATFIGQFNTGDITKSILVNGFAGDNDWNLIGNPYPGAIDFDALYNYSTNSNVIDGCAFLWSHALPPLSTNPGNENLNFNQADYAVITVGSGNCAGGNTVIPTDFIGSGQGFFVIGKNGGGTITFTNSMRDTSNNDQFFSPNGITQDDDIREPQRLWLNLTSDNGVFNQILVAYVEGATNNFDGFSYDAPRNLSSGVSSIIYTQIDNDDRKFAVQGKNQNSLSSNEVIPVGFYTSIEDATLYSYSVAQLEGSFLNEHDIYIKDRYLDIIHNLKESDYTFTSDVGEFNDRFEIVFTLNPLSTGEFDIDDNALQIIELDNGDVKFKLNGSYQMKSIEIIDLLGRTLYNLDAESSSQKVFTLNNLSQSTYLARVQLTNGFVITKKAIKRK